MVTSIDVKVTYVYFIVLTFGYDLSLIIPKIQNFYFFSLGMKMLLALQLMDKRVQQHGKND